MSDRTTPKQQRGIDTRTRILVAANTVFEANGRDYLKMQDVQRESGVSIGTVYRYFKDRVALLNALEVYRGEQGLAEAPVTAVAPAEDDPQTALALETVAAIKRWCAKVIEKGEGQYDLKVAGELILREIETRNL